jgi:hypothetical protein
MERNMFDTLHLWSSKILTMVCDFISCLVTISLNVEMLHNSILGVIEEMQSKVVATLALGLRPKQGFAKVRAKIELRSHISCSRECKKV